MEIGTSFHRGRLENLEGAHLLGTLSDGRRGSRIVAFLSEERQFGGLLRRTPVPRTLEDMLRTVPDTGNCLRRGPVGEPGGDSLAETFEGKR